MPHPPLNVQRALDEASGRFEIQIRHTAALGSARQTGFVWTRQPGVVCLAMTRAYLAQALRNPDVSAIVAPASVADRTNDDTKSLVVCDRADELFHYLHLAQAPVADMAQDRFEIDDTAVVDASALLRGHVRIAAGARIGPGVVISGPASVGRDASIEARAVIGCDGLYAKTVLGVRRHMPHFGGVEIGDSSRILAGAVVVRSAIHGEVTRVGAGACVGVLSNIGHDATIGDGATISSNVVVAGRSTVGAQAWIGASATISNMVDVGERAEVRLGAVVLQDVPPGGDVSGNFARSHAANMRRFLEDIRK
jgi:acyl-[acyl carrier protein]--UDP-N-acetylglucosamine O-acyltransferase